MNSLRNISLLITRCDLKMRRNEALLLKQEQQRQAIEQKIATLNEEISAISAVRNGLYAQGELTREKLFAIRRRQGLLRKKIAEMAVQRSQQLKEQEKCLQEQQKTLNEKQELLKKSNKYDRLQGIVKSRQRAIERWAEESEIEEKISCRK